MKKITLILLTVIFATACFADNSTAYKIMKILNAPVYHAPLQKSLNEEEKKAHIAERKTKEDKLHRAMSELLEKEMTDEELEQTLEFLKSKAGEKFTATINGSKMKETVAKVLSGKSE